MDVLWQSLFKTYTKIFNEHHGTTLKLILRQSKLIMRRSLLFLFFLCIKFLFEQTIHKIFASWQSCNFTHLEFQFTNLVLRYSNLVLRYSNLKLQYSNLSLKRPKVNDFTNIMRHNLCLVKTMTCLLFYDMAWIFNRWQAKYVGIWNSFN